MNEENKQNNTYHSAFGNNKSDVEKTAPVSIPMTTNASSPSVFVDNNENNSNFQPIDNNVSNDPFSSNNSFDTSNQDASFRDNSAISTNFANQRSSYDSMYSSINNSNSQSSNSTIPNANMQGSTNNAKDGHTSKTCTKENKTNGKVFILGFAGALIACILFFAIGNFAGIFGGSKTIIGGDGSNSASITASEDSSSLAEQVASKSLPSVVSVNVYGESQSSSIFDYLNGKNNSNQLTQTSTGSGVIVSKDGYIVTNQHVINGGKKFEVVVNGETKEAKLVGEDASSDIAVLKVDTDKELTPIELGDSDNIKTGEWVMSIGNPFGLEQSVATGIISATSRSQIMDSSSNSNSSNSSTAIYPNMIQTDAAINPGNSGGALVDSKGQLIGINTLITSYSGNYSGVGFAIPVNYAIGIAKDLMEGKDPSYAQLGVSLSTINEQYAKRFGFAVNEGAYVSSVTSGSGAEKAGIQKGDIITEFNGEKVTSASDLILDVRKKNPGDKVSIKLYRGSEVKTLEVTLGEGTSKQ